MKMREKRLLLAMIVCLLLPLGGCSRRSVTDIRRPLRVVTQIDIVFENGPLFCRRHYSDNGKMTQVLNYLRRIDPYGTPQEDPDSAGGSLFQIRLTYSDGSHKLYQQRSDRFLRQDDGPWKIIDPRKAESLSLLLGRLDSDPQEI